MCVTTLFFVLCVGLTDTLVLIWGMPYIEWIIAAHFIQVRRQYGLPIPAELPSVWRETLFSTASRRKSTGRGASDVVDRELTDRRKSEMMVGRREGAVERAMIPRKRAVTYNPVGIAASKTTARLGANTMTVPFCELELTISDKSLLGG